MRNAESAARHARQIIDKTTVELAEQACSHRDDPGHDHDECLTVLAAHPEYLDPRPSAGQDG